MTTKRRRVPAALHAELTEHTNLVRALRTARTLDITTHLLRDAGKENKEGWTQWPLVDCPVPEWSLAEEIEQLGASVLDRDLDGMPPSTAKTLVLHTAGVLVRVLHLLADQRPSAPGSMQKRVWPMNWEDVICLLAVNGALQPTVLARARARLERVYGPSHSTALERVATAKTRVALVEEDQLLAPPLLSLRTRRSSQPAARLRVKTRPVVDTDTD